MVEYTFPFYLSSKTKNLISGMLRHNPDERMSVRDVILLFMYQNINFLILDQESCIHYDWQLKFE